MFGLDKKELALLKKLNTPIKIQNYLDSLPINWEKKGETYLSPREVIRKNKAHCLEGALLAATALWIQGEKPLLLDLKTIDGDDHVVALYKINNYWGAISKTNHPVLRFRDPVYETIHELALSYFHEYFDTKTGEKTLYCYSDPFDMKKFGTDWITSGENLFHIADALDDAVHYELYPEKNRKYFRNADALERKAGSIIEWEKSNSRT
jgi:hypothetical protein